MIESVPVQSQIRSMVHADLELVLTWRNHPEIRRYMFTQHEITLGEHQRWFERTLKDQKKHLFIFEEGQQPLGFVNFNETGDGGVADWGFYVAPDAPKGSGQKLGCAALNHAFTYLNLHKVNGQALDYNDRSIQFHQTLGFLKEGILREQNFDGKSYQDVICFGLLGHEWCPPV